MLLAAQTPLVAARAVLQEAQVPAESGIIGPATVESSVIDKKNMATILQRYATPQENAIIFTTFSLSEDKNGELPYDCKWKECLHWAASLLI